MTNPIGIHATHPQALAHTPPRFSSGPSDKHIARALDQINDELQLSEEDVAAQLDFIERVEARARELALVEQQDIARREANRYIGIAVDACGLLQELQTHIANLNFFSPGDTGLSALCQAAERISPLVAKLRKVQS